MTWAEHKVPSSKRPAECMIRAEVYLGNLGTACCPDTAQEASRYARAEQGVASGALAQTGPDSWAVAEEGAYLDSDRRHRTRNRIGQQG